MLSIIIGETLIQVFCTILSGFFIYITLIFIKQNWVNTIHYFLTFLLLPPITFIITKVISNNLALSLGMIGALSIVRFRNPVKNPLELVIFFALITCGISFGVNIKWGLLLVSIVLSILIISKIFELIVKKFTFFNLFKYSFSTNDGLFKNIIEVESDGKVDFLENHPSIIYESNNDNKFFYKISLTDKNLIKSVKEKINSNKNITNIQIRYGD